MTVSIYRYLHQQRKDALMHPMKHRDRHRVGTEFHPHDPQHFHHPAEDFAEGDDRLGRRPGPRGGGPRGGHRGPGGRGPGGRGRAPRGDVRSAVLLLLAEEPMHGYQLMQAIADRSGGRWTPSPGAIYPTLNQLEDEGLVTVDRGVRPQARHPDRRRPRAGRRRSARPGRTRSPASRGHARAPTCAACSSSCTARPVRSAAPAPRSSVAAAAEILADARRAIYLLLADGPEAGDE